LTTGTSTTRTSPGRRSGAPARSTSTDFDAQRYWRGPTWLNTSWLVWRGLRVHGLDDMAEKLAAAMLQLAHTSGFREYFDPHTRSGHGTREFGWSAALVLDVLEALENPSPGEPQRS
jgi:glycogen debranching enzyme